ncbi:MAG: hypothetical protein ACYC3X_06110 [Pirellulaceae bacterium]
MPVIHSNDSGKLFDRPVPDEIPESDTETPEPAPDPFDPESLRLSQDFAATIGVKKVLTVVRCRKPNRQEFVRVRPGAEWRLETATYEDKILREIYLVAPALRSELLGEVDPVCLFLAVNRQSDPFLWQVKLPGSDGRSNPWNESALAAAQLAQRVWVRVASNQAAGMYDAYQAGGSLTDPVWPELSFPQILKLCFKDRFVETLNHPVLKQLRGEV